MNPVTTSAKPMQKPANYVKNNSTSGMEMEVALAVGRISLKEKMIRMSRRGRRRDPDISSRNASKTRSNSVTSQKHFSTLFPRKGRIVTKVKSLSPCKNSQILEIPKNFEKQESASNFFFTNIFRSKNKWTFSLYLLIKVRGFNGSNLSNMLYVCIDIVSQSSTLN